MKKYFYYLPHPLIYYGYKCLFRKQFDIAQQLRAKEVGPKENSLKGFDEYQCIFIHIPKAAGVSLSISLFGDLGGGHKPIYSYQKVYSPKEFNDYFKFTIVRNPWDRLVSAYYFLKEGGFHDTDKKWFDNNLKKFKNFEDFVLNWLSNKNKFSYTHFIPQHNYICLNDKILVDKVYKIENMQYVIQDLNTRLNSNISNMHRNKTKNRTSDYRSYYSKKTRTIVHNVYAKDIELFNYSF